MQLLLELFCEEIPARLQKQAKQNLKMHAIDALKKVSLGFDEIETYATPRRLTLMVDGLPERQRDIKEEKRGPKISAPKKALDGFLRSNKLKLEQCVKKPFGKEEFWFATISRSGRPAEEVLTAILLDIIGNLSWPKSMRWGEGRFRWVRPLKRVLCVLDGKPLDLKIAEGIPCGNTTSGHRLSSSANFEVGFFDDYDKNLQNNLVVLNPNTRSQIIEEKAKTLVEAEGLRLKPDPQLLEEVAGLVEWPVPLMGKIDTAFMSLPDEVLVTAMRSHQKYFSVIDEEGKLAPRFVVVANTGAPDGGEAIILGNERVLRARLSDAKFFWDQDRKQKLETRIPRLAEMKFHQKLGSISEKVKRIEELAEYLALKFNAEPELARRAGFLCKSDLMTGMVGEFPNLQGVMAGYYALEDGENSAVADALRDHYAPVGPNDKCPDSPISVAVSIADKIDTLVGFFGIDEKPTGSRDPFGLRRAALGIIRLLLENGFSLSLTKVISKSIDFYNNSGGIDFSQKQQLAASLVEFFSERLKVYLKGQGIRHDLISAIFSNKGEDDLVRLVARVKALRKFLDTEDGTNLLAAHKRAQNIVSIEEKKTREQFNENVDQTLLQDTNEIALFNELTQMVREVKPLLEEERFDEAMIILAKLRQPTDKFFEAVMVNAEDPNLRTNRLRLLSKIGHAMGEVADFKQIEG